jgi:predicted Zn-dependent protease
MTVTVYAYEFASNSAYHFVTVVPNGQGAGLESLYQSVRRLTTAEAAAIKPRKLVVVTAKSSDTVATMAARMAYDSYKTERFLTLNRLDANALLKSGQRVKIVTY